MAIYFAFHLPSLAKQSRRHGLPRIVLTSPRVRCREVGRWLARWGWRHEVFEALSEVDFGRWDGRGWDTIARDEIDTWCADFMQHAPGGGEPVAALLRRVAGFDPGAARIVVTHGGWLSAALWLERGERDTPTSERWPAAPRHGAHVAMQPRR